MPENNRSSYDALKKLIEYFDYTIETSEPLDFSADNVSSDYQAGYTKACMDVKRKLNRAVQEALDTMTGASERAYNNTKYIFHAGYNRSCRDMKRIFDGETIRKIRTTK